MRDDSIERGRHRDAAVRLDVGPAAIARWRIGTAILALQRGLQDAPPAARPPIAAALCAAREFVALLDDDEPEPVLPVARV
jgi:hypothetical protein